MDWLEEAAKDGEQEKGRAVRGRKRVVSTVSASTYRIECSSESPGRREPVDRGRMPLEENPVANASKA
jgi:hypothetical protein